MSIARIILPVSGGWIFTRACDSDAAAELRRAVAGISEKMLIQELKEMELDGIVARKDFKEVPPRVEYSLTTFGVELGIATRPLCEWGTRHIKRIGGLPTQIAAE